MLFHTISDIEGGYPLPAEEWLDVVAKSMDLMVEYKKQGKIVFHGAFVGRSAGCMIWDVASHTELQSLLVRLPLWPFMDWETIPLISTEDTVASVKQAQEAVRSSQ